MLSLMKFVICRKAPTFTVAVTQRHITLLLKVCLLCSINAPTLPVHFIRWCESQYPIHVFYSKGIVLKIHDCIIMWADKDNCGGRLKAARWCSHSIFDKQGLLPITIVVLYFLCQRASLMTWQWVLMLRHYFDSFVEWIHNHSTLLAMLRVKQMRWIAQGYWSRSGDGDGLKLGDRWRSRAALRCVTINGGLHHFPTNLLRNFPNFHEERIQDRLAVLMISIHLHRYTRELIWPTSHPSEHIAHFQYLGMLQLWEMLQLSYSLLNNIS